jgi:catechol 2,3-dioxygenase-like lactoylglutathione lyase family enzyme
MGEPKIQRCDHIGISVSDMDRAIRFFGAALGARVTEPHRYEDPKIGRASGVLGAQLTICMAYLGDYSFELLQYHTPDDRRASDLRPCDAGHIHLALKVEGIEELVARMQREGFEPAGPVQYGLGGSGLAATYLYGFDGLVVELIEAAAPPASQAR